MKKIFILTVIVLISFKGHSQALPELSKYAGGGRIEAEIVTINPARDNNGGHRFTSYGKCNLMRSGNKLIGNYKQVFSDRNQFSGDRDNTGIEIDLRNGNVTLILNTWGGGRDVFTTQIRYNGKMLVSTSNNESQLAVSLDLIRGQAID